MVLQAFIDDSYEQNGVFVLGGYISTAEAWARFSKEWEEMLPHGTLSPLGGYHFKMQEMAANPERMSRVAGFYRIAENHALGSISCKINIAELKGIAARLVVPGASIDWGVFLNPYFVAFRGLMDMFHLSREKFAPTLPLDQKIDFYFDEQSEKKAIREMWDNYIKQRPDEIRKYYGNEPRFEDDRIFLPLQAADLWAWWVRKWYVDGTPEKIEKREFGIFEPARKPGAFTANITFDQDQLVVTMRRLLRAEIGPDRPIFDAKFSPPKKL